MTRQRVYSVARLTLWVTIFLVGVGGLVRASGSGLGCPDWPMCFGLWVPPTSVENLPPGFDPAKFNVYQTWIEYLNRLVGALVGVLHLATFVAAIFMRPFRTKTAVLTGVALAAVIIQALIGMKVVTSELEHWIITIHMVVAMLIVGLLLFITRDLSPREKIERSVSKKHKQQLQALGWTVMAAIGIQIILGVQVREHVDIVTKNIPDLAREYWLHDEQFFFPVHRTFSWILLLSSGLLWYQTAIIFKKDPIVRQALGIFLLVVSQMATGIILSEFAFPPAMQIFHLLGIALLFALCWNYILDTRETTLA